MHDSWTYILQSTCACKHPCWMDECTKFCLVKRQHSSGHNLFSSYWEYTVNLKLMRLYCLMLFLTGGWWIQLTTPGPLGTVWLISPAEPHIIYTCRHLCNFIYSYSFVSRLWQISAVGGATGVQAFYKVESLAHPSQYLNSIQSFVYTFTSFLAVWKPVNSAKRQIAWLN